MLHNCITMHNANNILKKTVQVLRDCAIKSNIIWVTQYIVHPFNIKTERVSPPQQPPVGQGPLIHEVSRSQRRTTVGRTPLDEWSARRKDLYLTTHNTHNKHPCPRWDSKPQSRRATADLRLRPRGHWDWQYNYNTILLSTKDNWIRDNDEVDCV